LWKDIYCKTTAVIYFATYQLEPRVIIDILLSWHGMRSVRTNNDPRVCKKKKCKYK